MKPLKLIASFVISFAAAGLGSLATTPNIPTWYAGLDKPFFNPPNWLFGPVWTVLYALMAISLYLVWTSTHAQRTKHKAYQAFAAQIILNTLWSIVFFGLHLPWLGLVVILLLDAAVILTIRRFKPISRTASYLLYPYLAWILFASLLTVSLAILN